MKTTLLDQIRKRRQALGLKILDMPLLAGLTRQQYGKIEAGGNPRLSSLDQIAEGLESVLVLVPKSKLQSVERILESESQVEADQPNPGTVQESAAQSSYSDKDDLNPWGRI